MYSSFKLKTNSRCQESIFCQKPSSTFNLCSKVNVVKTEKMFVTKLNQNERLFKASDNKSKEVAKISHIK